MGESRKTGEIINGLMKNNRDVTRAMGLDARKEAVVKTIEGMGNVKKDIKNWKGYQQEAFLKAIDKERLGFRAEKAIHDVFETRKPEPTKPKINENAQRKKEYDAVIAKRKSGFQGRVEGVNSHESSKVADLSAGDKGYRRADKILHEASEQTYNHSSRKSGDVDESVKEKLRSIQSLR